MLASDVTTDEIIEGRRAHDALQWMRHAWISGALHATGSALLLLTTGVNIVLSAHYPLVSAVAILFLAYGTGRGSRTAALLLFLATATPVTIKLILGALHAADLPAFPLAALYLRGFLGTVRFQRLRGQTPQDLAGF
jgi:hypothetical protein